MSRIYMYPKNDYETLESPNPYVNNVEASLSEKHIIVNKTPNYKGVLELFPYLFKADIFFFNWVEDVSVKKYGKIQAVLFPVFLFMAKVFNKKIIWVLHNKYSHEKRNRGWIKFGFKLMIKHSNLILTHSNAGVDFVKENFPKHAAKVKYIIHPVEDPAPPVYTPEKKYDLLIWGTIHPYKGVIDFLKVAQKSPEFKNLKIMVSGICPDPREKKQLNTLISKNILHIDKFQTIEEIAQLISESRVVLFTYNSESILSSGSLMDSIRMGTTILGPDKGSFHDLNSYSFIRTYNTFEDIIPVYKKFLQEDINVSNEIEKFCMENNWALFSEKLIKATDGIL